MNAFLNFITETAGNEIMFFVILVLGSLFIGLVGLWLYREIRGSGPGPGQTHGGTAGDGSLSAVYRGSAGTTRTMDSSPSGILGAINRSSGRSSQPIGTSIISGSGVSPGLTTDRDRSQIEPELRQAGYYRPSALAEYKSVRALLVVMPLVLAAAVSLLVEPARMPAVVLGGMLMAGLGYSIPRVYIAYKARYRRREIERGLPMALDMMVLGLVAGQNIMNSFQRVSHEIRRAFPVLSEEMSLAYRQAELNTLGHALRVWADRCGVQEVYNLSVILTQSERQGADVANSLLEFASSYRVTLRQRAEATANRASFWMLFPTVLCMWIPATVLMAAPVFMEFGERRAKMREMILPAGANKGDTLNKQFQPYLQGANPQPQ